MSLDPPDAGAPSPPASRGSVPLPPHPARRDALPWWVIGLLAVFAALRLTEAATAPQQSSRVGSRLAQKADGSLDSSSMQDLIQADLKAKTAYALSLAQSASPGAVVHPDVPSLQDALKAAETLLGESHAPGAARRVILLRALLAQRAVPPLAAVHGFVPLDAFTNALPADLPAPDKARYGAEGRLWQTVFEGGRLTPKQTAAAAAQIRALPGIRWWRNPALQALYGAQGDLSEANRFARAAQRDALPFLAPVVVLILFRVGLMLLGGAWLLYFLVRPKNEGAGLWPTVPAAVPDAERRLGAGDLMAVFVVYLLAREVIGWTLTGFGIPHRFHVSGLLTPYLPLLKALPAARRSAVSVGLEAAVYVLSAVPPILYLWAMARARGASLAREIGWQARPAGRNLLYGLGGFGVASALMLPAALIGRAVFRHAPDPSNPVIPQLVGASGVGTILLLVGLASVAAPLVEEVLFRGVLYQAARLKLGVWPAIVVTGLVFGFAHPVGVAEMLAIAVLGGVFAWMAETRKSLLPSMFAHCLQNLSTTLLLLFILAG